jgi:hypothetical protein
MNEPLHLKGEAKPDAAFDPRISTESGTFRRRQQGHSRRPGDEATPPFTPKERSSFLRQDMAAGIAMTGNDPTGECNPAGMPRAILYPRRRSSS